jgi:hypothetical protein
MPRARGKGPLSAIDNVEPARRTVGAAYAKRHCDEDTFAVIEALEAENAALRADIDGFDKYRRARNGRWVFGRAVAMGILMLPVMYQLYWWAFSTKGRIAAADIRHTAHIVAVENGWVKPDPPAPGAATVSSKGNP